MKTTLYKKVGRRYKPVSIYDDVHNNWPFGSHVVVCNPTSGMRIYNIDPDFASMIAAGTYATDAIVNKIMAASALETSKKLLTEEQRAAWQALAKSFGDDLFPLQYPSYRDAAQAGVKAMQAEAEKMLSNPAVRRAWDNFMLLCKLTMEQKE